MEQNNIVKCMACMDSEYKKQIEAYLDNELSEDHAQKVRETIARFPALSDYATKVKEQRELLKLWWANNKNKHH